MNCNQIKFCRIKCEPLGELLLVVDADHLEEVEVAVEGLVLVLAQLLHHRLDPQHQELVPAKKKYYSFA